MAAVFTAKVGESLAAVNTIRVKVFIITPHYKVIVVTSPQYDANDAVTVQVQTTPVEGKKQVMYGQGNKGKLCGVYGGRRGGTVPKEPGFMKLSPPIKVLNIAGWGSGQKFRSPIL